MSTKVTIYARAVDHEIWEWARHKADTERNSLARVVADALRAYRRQDEIAVDNDRAER